MMTKQTMKNNHFTSLKSNVTLWFFIQTIVSLLRSRYLGRHATLSGGEALRDDPNNGCGGD